MNRRVLVALIGTCGLALLVVGVVGALVPAPSSHPRAAAIHATGSSGANFETAVVPADGQNLEGVEQLDGLPDCIPVTDRSGRTVGCVQKSDEFAPPSVFDAMSTSGGIPVYDLADHTRVVGTLDGGVGFVPNALADQKTELRTCTDSLIADLKGSPDAGPLSQECRDLLGAQGYPASTLDGR